MHSSNQKRKFRPNKCWSPSERFLSVDCLVSPILVLVEFEISYLNFKIHVASGVNYNMEWESIFYKKNLGMGAVCLFAVLGIEHG